MFAGVTPAVPSGREARLRSIPSLKDLGYFHMALRAGPFGMRANGRVCIWCSARRRRGGHVVGRLSTRIGFLTLGRMFLGYHVAAPEEGAYPGACAPPADPGAGPRLMRAVRVKLPEPRLFHAEGLGHQQRRGQS